MQPDHARMIERLERLVSFNTENPPGREIEAAHYLHEILKGAGFDTGMSEYKPGRVNVVARIENGPGPTFAFNSHIDVVPAGTGWSADPFRLRAQGENLYGRGSCDAKGPIIGMVEALEMLAANRADWSGTMLGVFVADEEVGSEGAKEYVKGRPSVDFCLIGEPTSNATVTAHKGSLRPIIAVHGATAHSGIPDTGENAILKAGRLLGLIEDHHKIVRERTHPLCGTSTITVTRLSGGHADNAVPDRCEFMIDRRMVPGEDELAARKEIEDLLVTAEREYGVRAEILEWKPTTGGPTETDPEHPIVAASLAAAHTHEGGDQSVAGFQGGCDLVHFRAVGAQGTVMGPGSINVAHKPDEFVPRDEFVRSSLIYRDVALRMLANGDDPIAE